MIRIIDSMVTMVSQRRKQLGSISELRVQAPSLKQSWKWRPLQTVEENSLPRGHVPLPCLKGGYPIGVDILGQLLTDWRAKEFNEAMKWHRRMTHH